jgi:hypothetical protein
MLDCALPELPTHAMETNQIDQLIGDLAERVTALRGYL